MDERLERLRANVLSVREIADFAADAGSQNYLRALPEIERLLDHADAIVRYNALATLAYEWGTTSRLPKIHQMIIADTDDDCRRQAVGALGSLLRGTKDRTALDILVRLADNSAETPDLRSFAYTAALDILGVPQHLRPRPLNLEVGEDELRVLHGFLRSIS